MTITLGEAEGAILTFFSAFLGYLVSASFVFSSSTVGAAAVTGGVAALGFLGYNVLQGNVSKSS